MESGRAWLLTAEAAARDWLAEGIVLRLSFHGSDKLFVKTAS